ncbi:MAG: LamG-like jellyroll fold domain-containing protein [Pseudomonadales bacterium]
MPIIEGKAKKYDGTSIDYVLLFDWATGNYIGKSMPNASGNWQYEYTDDLNIGITYVADGCEPITHGAYQFLGDPNVQSPPILRYTFDNNLLDSSSNQLHGVKSGSVSFVIGRKANTYCASFAGGTISTPGILPISGSEITVSFWISRSNNDTAMICELSNDSNKSNGLAIYQQAGDFNTIRVGTRQVDNTGSTITNVTAKASANALTLNSWCHVCISVSRRDTAKQITAHVNNQNVISDQSFSGITNDFDSNVLYIGSRAGTSLKFTGKIQNFKIYDRIITDDERIELFNE